MPPATLHLTKLAAAKRQLQAAIRLFFLQEDELAIHTVASASYSLLKDIKRNRGMSEAADSYLTAFFYIVRDFRRGTLPDDMTSNPAFMAAIQKIAEQLSPITADSKVEDLKVTISAGMEKFYWNKTNRVANFLKHADNDATSSIFVDEVDNRLLLMKCCSAYRDIAPDDLGNEGSVFSAFIAASNRTRQSTASAFESLVSSIRKVSEDDRMHLCYKVIQELNKAQATV